MPPSAHRARSQGPAIVTAQHQPSGLPVEQGFTTGFLLFGGVAVVALLVAMVIPAVRKETVPSIAAMVGS